MILLAIDTATECCSAALWADDQMYYRTSVQPRLHAEIILPFVTELLLEAKINKADIQGLVVAQGPGAFTGVRIGVAVTQGIALALNIPVVAVSNLKTLAFTAYKSLNTSASKKVLVATDARMNEVYWAKYLITKNTIAELLGASVSSAAQVKLDDIDTYIGSGFNAYPELIEFAKLQPINFNTNVFSQADDMLLMVKDDFNNLAGSIDGIEPVYLREP
ncbi:MAG: tRNA (adenosine(37)-N6)-threonylcarbamoyltransferase complex dimerization subunit type 1 TsaB [Proteobacteria bacterium]|nr:tRNA (adenosine(37)-N6)-threonylcarbamoyltransferase complex dimerization subunit type 1 TsaB [Pseudomonadota bacterium]